MNCPSCAGTARCWDSRPAADNTTRRRWRCLTETCGTRFSTIESVITVDNPQGENLRHRIFNEVRERVKAALEAMEP